MPETPFRFRWTARESWGPGYFDGRIGRWKVAQITPAGGTGGNFDGRVKWNLPIVMQWWGDLPGPYNGEADTPRQAVRAAEAAFPRIVMTHSKFFMGEMDEDMLRVVLQRPMPKWMVDEFVKHHSRRAPRRNGTTIYDVS